MLDQTRADEIYVGYLPVPPGQRRFLRWLVPAALWVLCGVGFMWTRSQRAPAAAVWDQSRPMRLSGTFIGRPYPMLLTTGSDGQPEMVLLVELGKRAGPRSAGVAHGEQVTVSGWPLYRDGRRILELEPGDEAVARSPDQSKATMAGPVRAHGRTTLRGEIVDSKCFLGAMKPGEGKTHKQCATLCIRGGIPPMLVSRDSEGRAVYYLLQSPDGGPADTAIEPFIADPVEVSGEVNTWGDLRMLSVRPADIRRL